MDSQLIRHYLSDIPIRELFAAFPYTSTMFDAIRLDVIDDEMSVVELLATCPDESLTDYGFTKTTFADEVIRFIDEYGNPDGQAAERIESITVLGGRAKDATPEHLDLTIRCGEIVCIVGPTGAGKSRLLEDIECLAQGDTPTGRTVLVNGEHPSWDMRYALNRRLVAQITQNMSFVMDLTVGEFIGMHAEGRGASVSMVERVIACANGLSGESFEGDMPVTQLSGGQSRALMTADTALLSASPIVLIDEIENAGIDRAQALDLLVGEGKIVLLSTHDPVLALSGSKRLVIRNGAVASVLEATEAERRNLEHLRLFDAFILELRDEVRSGARLEGDLAARFAECARPARAC